MILIFLVQTFVSLLTFLGKDRSFRKSVDLDGKVLTDVPSDFSHSFIDKGATARVPVLLFGYLLKQQMTIEICRCTLEETFEFLKKVSVMNTFHHQTGWFSSQSLDALRSYVIELVSKLTKEYTQLTDIPFLAGPSNNYDATHFERTWPKIEAFMNLPNPSFHDIEKDYPDVPATIVWMRRYQLFAQANTETVERKVPRVLGPKVAKDVDESDSSSESQPPSQPPPTRQKAPATKSMEEVKAFQFFNDSDSEESY